MAQYLEADFQKEVRFAVVLYGGVSLAIYINGVAQELLRLVRATAPDPKNLNRLLHNAAGTEQVYRDIGRLLGACAQGGQDWEQGPVRTRFLVDIVSGTSAGGINGVFLAKALAMDQSLDQLKELWKTEGDIDLLLNDSKSAVENIDLQDPPRSLLNSQRMYWKLYEAMQGMDEAGGAARSPYVDELDLFVTATDLQGRVLPLPMTGGRVFERRHRAVLHFRYASDEVATEPENFFTPDYTPLLAFAARCTSSFPFAFEPMQLTDAMDVLQQKGIVRNEKAAEAVFERWKQVTSGYTGETGLPSVEFPHRAFADGGDLDNKPFSFAIEALTGRQASLPVSRKLLYVEPAPEQPDRIVERARRPDAIENTWAAVSTLPRHETIRQDLEQILDRNEQVDRTLRLVEHIEKAAAASRSTSASAGFKHASIKAGQWTSMDTVDLFKTFGRGYLTYHRLKISSVTDDLAAVLCRHFEVEHGSTAERGLRYMVTEWRDRHYGSGNRVARARDKVDQYNRFLLGFDIRYRVRRMRYLKRLADEAACWDRQDTQFAREIGTEVPPERRAEFCGEVREIARQLREPYKTLRTLSIAPSDVAALARLPDLQAALQDDPKKQTVRDALDLHAAAIETAACRVLRRFGRGFRKVRNDIGRALDAGTAPNDGARLARVLLRRAYDRFEDYDSITFPVLHDTGVGELSVVDVTRISPLDATALIDEGESKKSKLRGTALGNFGAFLDRGWRENDILWGRLDGAERIITALLPDSSQQEARSAFIRRAHDLILEEELGSFPGPGTARERFFQYLDAQRTEPDRDLTARALARSTTIIGQILDRIAKDRRWEGMPFATLTRVGRILWGAIEVATPRSLTNLFFRHFLHLLYLFGAVLTLAGTFLTPLQPYGIKLLLYTFGAHLAVALVRDYLTESRRVVYAIGVIAGLALTALLLVGALEVANVVGSARRISDVTGGYTAERITGVACLLTIFIGWWMSRQGKRLQYAGGARPEAPMLELEFARNPEDIARVAGELWHPNRRVLASIQEADVWLIGGYVTIFCGLGVVSYTHGWPGHGAITAIAGVLAGLFDLLENRAINAALRKKLADAKPLTMARPAAIKWSLVFAALAAEGFVLLHDGGSMWALGVALAAFAAAVCGFSGLAIGSQRLRLLPLATLLTAAAVVVLTILLLVAPKLLHG